MQLLDELVAGVTTATTDPTLDDGAKGKGNGNGNGNCKGDGDGNGDVFDAYDGAFNVESRQF